jgi:hypothetical protein
MSGTTVDDKVVRWMTKMLSSLTENGRVCRVELFHTIEGAPADRCIALGIEEGQDVGELSQELWEVAEHDSSTRDFGMPQRYVIRLFDVPTGDDHLAVYPFTIRGRATSAYSDSASEPANERGLMAQFMRTIENQNRLLVHNAALTSNELERAVNRARAAEDRELATRKLHEELQDRTVEREIQKAREILRAKQTHQVVSSVIPLIPLLLTKFLQGSLPGLQALQAPGEKAPFDTEIETFLKSLSREEMQGVMAALRGVNQLTMVEIWKSYQNPSVNLSASKSREMSVGQFLKALSVDETRSILRTITEEHRAAFIAIYDRFAEEDAEAQKDVPTVLQDLPEDDEPPQH